MAFGKVANLSVLPKKRPGHSNGMGSPRIQRHFFVLYREPRHRKWLILTAGSKPLTIPLASSSSGPKVGNAGYTGKMWNRGS